MATLFRPGAELFYDVIPSETRRPNDLWVTLINGHTRTSSDFKLMAKVLSSRGWSVLVLDNRGSGKTNVSRGFTGQEMVDDIVAIWDDLGIKKSGVFGISMGGMIAQYVALRFPDRVSALILVSTTSHRKHITSSDHPWLPNIEALRAKLSAFFAKDFADKNNVLIEAMAKNTLRAMEGGKFQEGADMQAKAMATFDDPSNFSALKMPVLIMHGEEDQIITIQAAREFEEKIPESKLTVYPGVGHLILAENPKQLYGDVDDFLGQLLRG